MNAESIKANYGEPTLGKAKDIPVNLTAETNELLCTLGDIHDTLERILSVSFNRAPSATKVDADGSLLGAVRACNEAARIDREMAYAIQNMIGE